MAPTYNGETGEHEVDERGRYLFRTRDHDVMEFYEIVQRNGIWKRDLQQMAEVMAQKRKSPLFGLPAKPAAGQDATSIQ